MVKRIVISAGAAIALTIGAVHLGAYALSGHRWKTSQVPFYVNPANNDVSQDAAITALQAGAANWSAQTTAGVNIYYAGRTNGTSITLNNKNEIFFRNTSSGSTIATTYWWYGSDGKLLDADMMFYDGGFKFFTGQSGCSGGVFVEDIATHEFGHFIGINHSSDSTATMYPTTSGWCNMSWRYLSQDDVNAVQTLYPASTTTTAPVAPTAATAWLDATTPYVDLSWVDGSTNESGFKIERSSDGTTFTVITQTSSNVVTFRDTTTAAGKSYWYRIRSYNSGGSSAASNTATVAVPAPLTPAVAKPFLPLDGATGVTTTLTNGSFVRWYAADRATSYDVYFGTSSTPSKIATVVPPSGVSGAYPGTLYQGASLKAGTTYYWKVVSRNAGGSTSSTVWKFKMQ
jgi:Matrixin